MTRSLRYMVAVGCAVVLVIVSQLMAVAINAATATSSPWPWGLRVIQVHPFASCLVIALVLILLTAVTVVVSSRHPDGSATASSSDQTGGDRSDSDSDVATSAPSVRPGEGAEVCESTFRDVFHAAGGAPVLGVPVNAAQPAGPAGPGFVQFFGEGAGQVAICGVPRKNASLLPADVWQVIATAGDTTDPPDGVAAVGFPVSPQPAGNGVLVGPTTMEVDLEGGEWGPGQLWRAQPSGGWRWRPKPRLTFETRHRDQWSAGGEFDVRIRVVVGIPWPSTALPSQISRQRRLAVQQALGWTEFSQVFLNLATDRGAHLQAISWQTATGTDSFNSDRGIHLRCQQSAPDGGMALSGDVIVQLPDGFRETSLVGCVELRVRYEGLRAAAVGESEAGSADLRLSLLDAIEVLASAWGTAMRVIPLGAVDTPDTVALAGPPYAELHVQACPAYLTSSQHPLSLNDVVNLAALGRSTRDGQRQEAGFRVYAPMDIKRPSRRQWAAQGLAQLAQSWGYIEADRDRLLVRPTAV
ncbi:hypothetical protein AB0M43_36675 [Longispora sp. NPDC051575]|uniref:hypothetical protein n=1 Tax=Longispora sp. NPDC051575 TaxID=3154943 RepID=UPI003415B7E8